MLGGGVVGVACAYSLGVDGHQVTLVERNEGVAAATATSHANAGLVTPGDSYAWASPAALGLFLRSLTRSDLGLRISTPLDPALWSWSLRFLLQCTDARARTNSLRKLRLTLYSRECLDSLLAHTGIEIEGTTRGVLYFFRSAQSLERGLEHMQLLADNGLAIDVLDGEQLVRMDPALAPSRVQIAGGIHSPMDRTGDPRLFSERLAAWCVREQGLSLRTGTTVKTLDHDGARVRAVLTDQGRIDTDAVVLAMGCDSRRLAASVGDRLPIYPVKGYSLPVPVAADGLAPTLGGVDEDRLVAYSRLGGYLRIAASAEFAGNDRSHRPGDFDAMLRTACELFPTAGDYQRAQRWAGLRPMTPSSVPIHGAARLDNLFLDVGHGHVGWTMACGSARLVTDLVAGRSPEIDPQGLLWQR